MRAALLFTGNEPILIVTSHGSLTDPQLLHRLSEKGIDKFIGFEVPVALAEERYGEHFHIVMHDRQESDGLRVLDEGEGCFRRFRLSELGPPIMHDHSSVSA